MKVRAIIQKNFAVLAASVMATSVWGTNIPLSNPSLESPSYNTGGPYPGWAGVNNWEVNFTGWSMSGNRGASPVAHDGSQGLWSCWGAGWCGLSQNSTYTVQAAGETLTAGVWAKTDANVGPGGVWFNLQLRLNGSQVSYVQPNFPAGTDWTNITTSYVTTAADIGKTVGISFGTDGGANAANANYCYMDDASLTTSASLSTLLTWRGGTGTWSATNWLPGNVGGPSLTSQTAVVTNGSVTVDVNGGVGGITAINLARSGVLLVNNGHYGSYGNILFQGGSLDTSDGSSYHAYGSSVLTAVTASGSTNSTIKNSGGGWFNLAYPSTTFTVSNGATLTVSATLSGAAGSPDTSFQASGLIKAGSGNLVLSGANQYSGGTVVSAGTLSLSNAAALLAASSLTVSNGAVVNLGYSGTIPVGSLVLGGVVQSGGTYGATGSGATHINNTYFTGPGVLSVVAVNQDLTWTGAVNNNWDEATPNWNNGAGYNRWYNSQATPNSAIFGATGVGTVTLAAGITARSITFSNAGYTLTGGSLMLVGSRAITNHVNATIASPLDSSGLNKFGTGTLTLNGTSLYLGSLSVNVGVVSLTGSVLTGCTAVSLAPGAKLNLNFTGTNAVSAIGINGTWVPAGTYNAQHPVYGSYFTGTGSLRIYPLTYQLSPGNENWPDSIRAGLVAAMNEATASYNSLGYFPLFVWVNYDNSVATAEASYGGPCTFSANYVNAFTAIHELAHALGTGAYWAWQYNQTAYGQPNSWWNIGSHADQRIKLFDGPTAHIGCDTMHFSPYGMNYGVEDSPTTRYRHAKLVAAMRWDMGIVGDSNGDGVPDDWDMFWFGTPTQTSISASNDLAAYLADSSPLLFVPTKVTAALSGTNLTISWPADHTGSTLLVQTNKLASGISANTNDWMRVSGSSGGNSVVIPILPNSPGGYYRLVYP